MVNQSKFLGKTLSISVILLFLGVTVNPAIATVEPEKQPDDVEGLVAQIKDVVNEIQAKYGHIPMVRGLCNMIHSALGLVGNFLICTLLMLILVPCALLMMFFGLVLRMEYVGYIFANICLYIIVLSGDYCTPYNIQISEIPFNSLYTLSETKDCPCLEE